MADRTGKSPQIGKWPDWVVADAVAIEPVSASYFPANREKSREFCKFDCSNPILTDDMRVDSKAWG